MINKENLEASGYKFHHFNNGEYCLGLWQKKIKSPKQILYFINVWMWNFPSSTESSSSDVTFYREDSLSEINETSFKISLNHGKNLSILSMEKFYDEIYYNTECVPDFHNNF